MVNRTLIRGLDANVDDVVMPDEDIIEYLGGDAEIELNQILDGVVVRIEKEFVIVDVGYKSEGAIHVSEWEEGEETPKKQFFCQKFSRRPREPGLRTRALYS